MVCRRDGTINVSRLEVWLKEQTVRQRRMGRGGTRRRALAEPARRRPSAAIAMAACVLGTAVGGFVDAGPSTVGQHDLERVLSRFAEGERSHLESSAQKPRVSETGIGNVVFDGTIAMHRDAVLRRALSVQN